MTADAGVRTVSTEGAQKLEPLRAEPAERRDLQSEKQQAKDKEHDTDSSAQVANPLLPKFLRTTRMLLTSRSFFFAYDIDITRRLGTGNASQLPLHKSVDKLYFWNYNLTAPFVESGHGAFVLPLMQGFVGQRAFFVSEKAKTSSDAVLDDEQDAENVGRKPTTADTGDIHPGNTKFLLTLISRRSTKRPGLRYLRRGVDDEGNTANFVETEQILSKALWAPTNKVYSFTQIRGSIPLFFSQSPYSFKPVPVLQHSPETNQRAFNRHIADISRYGDIQIALLVDKKGGEAEIGQKYLESITQCDLQGGVKGRKLGFEWFDFHAVCRGMKFENVSLLMESLGPTLDEYGETVELEGRIQRKQVGIIRTNCMDCE